MENESQDPSVRFVRWIKVNDTAGTAHRRDHAEQSSRRTLRLMSSKSDLSDRFLDDGCVKSQREKRGWQCLEALHGIELCTVDSEAAGSYEEMSGFTGRPWT